MRKLIAIIIILFCIAIPARADYGPRPPAWETVAATKAAVVHERRQPKATATVTPWPTAVPYPAPYPEPEGEPPAVWRWLVSWFIE